MFQTYILLTDLTDWVEWFQQKARFGNVTADTPEYLLHVSTYGSSERFMIINHNHWQTWNNMSFLRFFVRVCVCVSGVGLGGGANEWNTISEELKTQEAPAPVPHLSGVL